MHFSVAVLVKSEENVHDLLAPFDENMNVEPYIARTKSELIQESKNQKASIEKRIKEIKDYEVQDWEKPFLDAKTDEEFYDAITEDYEQYDEEGNLLYAYNPEGRWDWYEIGGRWTDCLPLKDGETADYAPLKDINFDGSDEAYYGQLNYWHNHVINNDDDEAKRLKEKYNAETYAKSMCKFHTCAVIHDGKWEESEEIFSTDEDWVINFYDRFIKHRDPEDVLYVVDCHV